MAEVKSHATIAPAVELERASCIKNDTSVPPGHEIRYRLLRAPIERRRKLSRFEVTVARSLALFVQTIASIFSRAPCVANVPRELAFLRIAKALTAKNRDFEVSVAPPYLLLPTAPFTIASAISVYDRPDSFAAIANSAMEASQRLGLASMR